MTTAACRATASSAPASGAGRPWPKRSRAATSCSTSRRWTWKRCRRTATCASGARWPSTPHRRSRTASAAPVGSGPVPAVPAPRVRDPIAAGVIHDAERTSQDGRGFTGFYRLPQPDNGAPGLFRVNGRAPQPGGPFADPCRNTQEQDPPPRSPARADNRYSHSPLRVYEVSAVEMDLVVNAAGWHDPQAHINVLTSEAERVEARRMRAAPFFYRAHSGYCVEYRHQNRTKGALELDDFQVATPTDTIGQHIHLVKFDVLAADGSANGWNYEDGTFAASHIRDRVGAANGRGGAWSRDADGRRGDARRPLPAPAAGRFQTTIQRWYADRNWHEADVGSGPAGGPCTQGGVVAGTERECRDVTLRTVFTHDHFGPSSIQQHGFYSALLVEPEGSAWFTADGRPMCSGAESMPGGSPRAGCVMPVTQLFPPEAAVATGPGGDDPFASARALWRPNAQALIVGAGGNDPTRVYHRDHREFPMAIADFALLYAPGPPEVKPVSPLLSPEGRRAVMNWRLTRGNGWPVNPPEAPEAISQHHHDPYLVNFGQDALPLRIGRHSQMPAEAAPRVRDPDLKARCPQTRVNNLDEVRTQRAPVPGQPGLSDPGDLANAFDSWCHGDPFGELFEAYEGEEIQIRLIQGAQEVQHVFNAPGLRWRRDLDVTYGAQGTARDVGARLLGAGQGTEAERRRAREMQSGFVSAQEVGISEHFEFQTSADNVTGRAGAADFLWHFGSNDAIWNGAWGLIRFHNGTIRDNQKEWSGNSGGGASRPTPDATCKVAREMAFARGEAEPDCVVAEVRDRLLSVRAARRAIDRPEDGGAARAFARQRDGEHAYQSPRVHFPEWRAEGEPPREGIDAHACPSRVAWWLQERPYGAAAGQAAGDPERYWRFLPVRMRSYEVVAEPDSEPNGRGREVWRGEGGRIYDPRPLRFRAVRMAVSEGVSPPPESAYRPLPAGPAEEGPLVLRALAGECVHVRLLHRAPGAALNPVEGEARLPGIASLNVTYENLEGQRGPDGRPLDFQARAALARRRRARRHQQPCARAGAGAEFPPARGGAAGGRSRPGGRVHVVRGRQHLGPAVPGRHGAPGLHARRLRGGLRRGADDLRRRPVLPPGARLGGHARRPRGRRAARRTAGRPAGRLDRPGHARVARQERRAARRPPALRPHRRGAGVPRRAEPPLPEPGPELRLRRRQAAARLPGLRRQLRPRRTRGRLARGAALGAADARPPGPAERCVPAAAHAAAGRSASHHAAGGPARRAARLRRAARPERRRLPAQPPLGPGLAGAADPRRRRSGTAPARAPAGRPGAAAGLHRVGPRLPGRVLRLRSPRRCAARGARLGRRSGGRADRGAARARADLPVRGRSGRGRLVRRARRFAARAGPDDHRPHPLPQPRPVALARRARPDAGRRRLGMARRGGSENPDGGGEAPVTTATAARALLLALAATAWPATAQEAQPFAAPGRAGATPPAAADPVAGRPMRVGFAVPPGAAAPPAIFRVFLDRPAAAPAPCLDAARRLVATSGRGVGTRELTGPLVVAFGADATATVVDPALRLGPAGLAGLARLPGAPTRLALDPVGQRLFVASAAPPAMAVVDLATRRGGAVLSLDAPAAGIAWDAAGDALFVLAGDGALAAHDPETLQPRAASACIAGAEALAVVGRERLVAVAGAEAGLRILDAASLDPLHGLDLPAGGAGPVRLAAAEDDAAVFVSSGRAAFAVEARSGRRLARFDLAVPAKALLPLLSGQAAAPLADGSVVVLDAAVGALLEVVPAGADVAEAALAGSTLYLRGEATPRLALLDAARLRPGRHPAPASAEAGARPERGRSARPRCRCSRRSGRRCWWPTRGSGGLTCTTAWAWRRRARLSPPAARRSSPSPRWPASRRGRRPRAWK